MSKYNCESCGASGLYAGLCEPKETAVICLTCKGSGAVDTLNPYGRTIEFTGRKMRTDIKIVYQGGGRIIFAGAGPKGQGISYQDFWNGKMP